VALLLGLSSLAFAGGGPENVMLVVNRDSLASRTIANHYQHWRQIPPGNVLSISWPIAAASADIDTFRQKILEVILKEIDKRRLSGQIDYIVYSSDFPTGIDLAADVRRFEQELQKTGEGGTPRKWPNPPLTPVGSINGLTYLWFPVMAGGNAYFDLRGNAYMRRDVSAQRDYPTLAFNARQNFDAEGGLIDEPGRRYLLSAMLGVTAGRGNTVDEVLSYLQRAVSADGTQPKGTIYFAKNSDIRSTVRDRLFPAAVRELKAMGVNAEIVDGVLPTGKSDVQGAMVGAADFSWKTSNSTILPGAICEHFTSYGGIMKTGAGQTPLSEWLRHGAAGTSGTVVEPYALIDKFPVPAMHVHYARGCSLAEAYYQSVSGPYQLLIVGDPLCQPWAKIPTVKVDGVTADATLNGQVEIRPSATVPGGGQIGHFELFVDELRYAHCLPGETLKLDTNTVADGWHELRVVAVDNTLIRTQGRTIVPVTVSNRQRTIEASLQPTGRVPGERTLTVSASSPGSTGILVLHNGQLMGRINGEKGEVSFEAGKMGRGPIVLRVVGMGDKSDQYVWARPLQLEVQ
jgi:hypothetical protein